MGRRRVRRKAGEVRRVEREGRVEGGRGGGIFLRGGEAVRRNRKARGGGRGG